MGSLFFVLAVAVPLIEELLKAIGVLFLSYRRPSREQALWWGLLGGAGFAFAEGLFNGNLAFGDVSWGVLAPMRFGTTVLHCATGAVMGLAWYALVQRRRLSQWLRMYFLAVSLHGLWNALTLGLAFSSLEAPTEAATTLSAAVPSLVLVCLILLQVAGLLILLLSLVPRASHPTAADPS
jgi:RsiW-degrading membrane proteinase PrsW (M82 family)